MSGFASYFARGWTLDSSIFALRLQQKRVAELEKLPKSKPKIPRRHKKNVYNCLMFTVMFILNIFFTTWNLLFLLVLNDLGSFFVG